MQHIVDDARRRGARIFRWCVWDVVERCDHRCSGCPLRSACAGRARDARGFEEFSRERHVRAFGVDAFGRIDGEDLLWTCGVDFGFAGAFACLFLAVGRASGRVFVADEWLATRAVLEENAAALLGRLRPNGPWPRPRMVFCDVAGNAANAQTGWSDIGVLRAAGLDARGRALKIDEGVERIRALLNPAAGAAGLAIHPRCAALIRAFEGYRYAPGGQDILKDGTHDHPLDALRYALCGVAQGAGGHTERRYY